jgi:hypothetical protein
MNDIDKPNPSDEDASVDDEDEIIDLKDIVLPESEDRDDISGSSGDIAEGKSEDKSPENGVPEDLIESVIESNLELEDILDEEVNDEPEAIDDFLEDLGLDLEEDPELSEVSPREGSSDSEEHIQAVSVSLEQIEAAVERVVSRLFSDKIEGLLVSAVEKTVKKEIEKLKALVDEATENEDT